MNPPLPVRRALQQPHHRRAHADDAAAGGTRLVDPPGRARRHLAPLSMHDVAVRIVRLHRQERTGAHVQRQGRMIDARTGQSPHQRRSEVQPGGRGGHRALPRREHGLIILPVFVVAGLFPLDIWRQRHPAMRLEGGEQAVPGGSEIQHHLAGIPLRGYRRAQIGGERNGIALLQTLCRPGKSRPNPFSLLFVKGDFDGRFAARSPQPGGNNLGVVENHQIPRTKQAGQVSHPVIGQAAGHMQQPRGITGLHGTLCNRRGGQLKIKFVETHGSGR